MSSSIFDTWIKCLEAFDDSSLLDPQSVYGGGSTCFREELLIWGTQEVLPSEFSDKKRLDDENIRGNTMKESLDTIYEALTSEKSGNLYEPQNAATRQEPRSSEASQRTIRKTGEQAGKQKVPAKRVSSSDSESSAASESSVDPPNDGGITNALDKLFKLASFGVETALPKKDECPQLFETPGARFAFPRVSRLIAEKFPRIEDCARVPFAILLSIAVAVAARGEKEFPFQPRKASRRGSWEKRNNITDDVSEGLSSVSSVEASSQRYSLGRTILNLIATITPSRTSKKNPGVQYICVFPHCPPPYRLFDDEKSFLTHLTDVHRDDRVELREDLWLWRSINNVLCFRARDDLRKHLHEKYPGRLDEVLENAMLNSAGRNETLVHPAAWCPVCYTPVQTEPEALLKDGDELVPQFPAHLRKDIADLLQEALRGVTHLKKGMGEPVAV
ncbi:hypothetical protein F5Y14DRAFT_451650 [Nemania sp. NC0429]|nr:hypothetical protein F5Y14DRAFT_451650 [Nemania sp. NC0429]